MIRIISAQDFSRNNISSVPENVTSAVCDILRDVKLKGDEAVKYYERKFDRAELSSLELSEHDKDILCKSVSGQYVSMLERCAENIRSFHSRQLHGDITFKPSEGIMLQQKYSPINRAGIYIPGGRASYPSTVLMNAIPAQIAGVHDIMIATPPPVKPEIICAAKISGVNRIFTIGGAQAIGAFAFGTQSVPKADKITGPGNIYVAEAKRQVFGISGVDMIAGPSEIVIIADGSVNPAFLAADMIAQSEHDTCACAVMITTSQKLAQTVRDEIDSQLSSLSHPQTAEISIGSNGAIVLVSDMEQAVNLANDIAPEHLQICTSDALTLCEKIVNAGSIFIGENSPEALGDYYAGVNHTLPTMGTAKFSSPLSVDDFLKKSQVIYYSHEALVNAASDIEMFAYSEGLEGHARSIAVRVQ